MDFEATMLMDKVPCPPPFFYDEFGEYALQRNLSRNEVCLIATTCMGKFQTTKSSWIIRNICHPQTTTAEQTTTTNPYTTTSRITNELSQTTSAQQTTTFLVTTSSSLTTTTTPKEPLFVARPTAGCNDVCIILILLLLIAIVTAVIFIWKFKCYRRCSTSNLKKLTSFRKKSNRHRLYESQQSETSAFENPNYSNIINRCSINVVSNYQEIEEITAFGVKTDVLETYFGAEQGKHELKVTVSPNRMHDKIPRKSETSEDIKKNIETVDNETKEMIVSVLDKDDMNDSDIAKKVTKQALETIVSCAEKSETFHKEGITVVYTCENGSNLIESTKTGEREIDDSEVTGERD